MKGIVRYSVCCSLLSLLSSIAISQVSVLTQDYDNGRSGATLNETILKPINVTSAKFGKVFAYAVDEEVFAQPLFVPNLYIAGRTHNVVFIATMGNTVYAFDADDPSAANTPLWSVNLGTPVPSSLFRFNAGNGTVQSGIYSTPVIDPGLTTMYVVAHVWDTATQTISMQLHALDIANGGAELYGGPVKITAAGFNPLVNEQRAGLLLLNGVVYIAMGSHADFHTNIATFQTTRYVGMVLAYDALSLGLDGAFNAESGGMGASLWQGGRGLASDGTYVYAMTANALSLGAPDYSQSFVQLNPSTVTVASYYQDPDAACLNTLDLDLASSGPQVVPGGTTTQLLIGGGKEGKVYEFSVGQPLNGQVPNYFWGTGNYPTLPAEGGTCSDGRPDGHGYIAASDTAFWNRPSGDSYYYVLGNFDELMSWSVSANIFSQASADSVPSANKNTLALSANAGSDGILWTVTSAGGVGAVSAYDAIPAGGHLTPLWNSSARVKRDFLGPVGRYSVPTVANGKVYVATGSNQVAVYGLLPTTPSVQVTPANPTLQFNALGKVTDNIYINSLGGYQGTAALTVIGLPPGVTYSFSMPTVSLTSAVKTATTKLTISSAGAMLPLRDVYTAVVQATTADGTSRYAPVRLDLRNAQFTSATSAGCNASNQMSANLNWQFAGSNYPSIWIQDSSSPKFPGRLWIAPADTVGSGMTDYTISSKQKSVFYWAIDQSAGGAANFDNTLATVSLGPIYQCP